MNLTLTLPDAVHSLLAAHPKGAEAAALIAIKRYLKATASEGRDQAIADDAVRGATHAELANKYNLSIPRIQQLVALGRDAALLRHPPKPETHTTTIHSATKKQRVLTPEDIHNINRMRADGAMQSEIMSVFSLTLNEVQDVLWSAPTTTTTIHSATTPKPKLTTTTPAPSPDFEFAISDRRGQL